MVDRWRKGGADREAARPFDANALRDLKLLLPATDDTEQSILSAALDVVLFNRIVARSRAGTAEQQSYADDISESIRDAILESKLTRPAGAAAARFAADSDLTDRREGSLNRSLQQFSGMQLGGLVSSLRNKIQDAALAAPFVVATISRLGGLNISEKREKSVLNAFKRILFNADPDAQLTAEVADPQSPFSDSALFSPADVTALRADITTFTTNPPTG